MKTTAAVLAVLMLGAFGCVGMPVRLNTPSGSPEVVIAGATKKQVSDALINRMLSKGWTLVNSNEYQIVFRRQINSFGASLAYGSQYAVNPDARATANMVDAQGGVRVIMTVQAVTNPNSPYERSSDIRDAKDLNAIQAALENLKAGLESPAHRS